MRAEAVSALPIRGFIHRPAIDLLIMAGPWLICAGLLATGVARTNQATSAAWISQFVLGNTTHVILTFVLLGFRRDVLRATPSQAKLVVLGSLAAFAVTLLALLSVSRLFPFWVGFPLAIVGVFGTHHRLSQAKGIWSLYNLRASTLAMPPPTKLERSFQQHWVSLGLIVVMVAWLFVPAGPNKMFPLFQAIPNEAAMLPYEVSYGLAGVWVAFVAALLFVIGREPQRNVPKMLHIASHGAAVTLAVLVPIWGAIVWGAIHGLEYYFLCARMMTGKPGDTFAGPGSLLGRPALVWLLIIVSLSPIFLVGLANSPFAIEFGAPGFASEAVTVVNALVVAHYFADAFIYRFRIPAVRKVALSRLGFAQ